MFIQGAYVHMVLIYIHGNAYSSVHVLKVLLRGIDNVYVLLVLEGVLITNITYQQCLGY
jgi:hypothetical protein